MTTAEINNLQDSFKQAADSYELRMGQVTRSVAHHIVPALKLQPKARVCDNACGTGAVTESILSQHPDVEIDACDIAEPMTKIAEAICKTKGWSDRVKFQVADSAKLPYPDATFDADIMNFGIFFTPDPQSTANEIYRTLKPGGTAAVTCWKDSAFFRLTFAIQNIVQPANPLQGMPMFDRWKDSQMLQTVLKTAGFNNVKVEEVPVSAVLTTREQLVQYCVMNIRGALGNQWSAEEIDKLPGATAQVIASQGDQYFSTDEEGVTNFPWIAWIATATK